MKDVLTLTWKLFVITLIAGLLLGLTYAVTKDPIEQQTVQAATLARQEVLPDAASFEAFDMSKVDAAKYSDVTEIYIGKDGSGNSVGATIKLSVKGFNPGVELTVGIDKDGRIAGAKIGSNSETPGLGAKSSDPTFIGQFAGKNASGNLSVIKNGSAKDDEIVAITGATITSRGVTNGVNMACKCYDEYVK